MRGSVQQLEKRKKPPSVLMVSVPIAPLCSNQWRASTTFVPVKKLVLLSLSTILEVVLERKLDELRRSYLQEKGFTPIEM